MDGVWGLAEWHLTGGTVHHAPEAVGRFVFLGGTVSMLMRLSTSELDNHRYGIGRTVIEDRRLLYGYDQLFDYTRDSRGARSSPQVATGLRPYGLRIVEGRLICTGETHATRMVFAGDHLHVYDGQRLLRVWRREAG
jgi:hypothetical protein